MFLGWLNAVLRFTLFIKCYLLSRNKNQLLSLYAKLCYTGAMKIMIGFRVTKELKKFLQRFADEENRTLSSFLNNAALTYIKEHHKIDWRKEDDK